MLKWMKSNWRKYKKNRGGGTEQYEINIYFITQAQLSADRLKFWEELVKPTFLAMIQLALEG